MRLAIPLAVYFMLSSLCAIADLWNWVPKSPSLFWTFGAGCVIFPVFIALLMRREPQHYENTEKK